MNSGGSNEVAGAELLLGKSRLFNRSISFLVLGSIRSISFLVLGSRVIVIVVLGCVSGGKGGLLSFAILVFLVVDILLFTQTLQRLRGTL